MQTISAQITDAAIKRYAGKDVRQISDPKYPLKFRYSQNRDKGSFYVVQNKAGKTIWRKIGGYPGITAKKVVEKLPDVLAEMAVSPDSAAVAVGRFETVADLMNWYIDRSATARYLSEKRRLAIAVIARKHVIGKLGSFKIRDVDHAAVDRCLIVPMQASYSLAYTRQVYDILRLAFKQAQKLRQIDYNPIAAFKFTDFITAPIKARDGRLRSNSLHNLIDDLTGADSAGRMMALLMILHGTRIGETRQTKWTWIDWGDRALLYPADVTKTREFHKVPLTDQAIAILKRFRAEQEYNGYTGVYIFPNHRGNCISDGQAGEMIKRVSAGNWSAHDLRKLARTCWQDLGVDYWVAERLLNHKMSKLDQAYIHTHVENQKRAALDKYHAWLIKNGANVFLKDF